MEQVLRAFEPSQPYFWSTHGGAELDLVFIHKGKRVGFEIKFTEAPKLTASMRIAKADLQLDHLWVLHPGVHRFPLEEDITAIPLARVRELAAGAQSEGPEGPQDPEPMEPHA